MSEPAPPLAVSEPRGPGALSRGELAAMAGVTAGMIAATALRWWPSSWGEVIGFLTAGVCVWLGVRQHVGTWPLGIASNLIYFAVFWGGRLYADATLQLVFLALSLYGWWSWLRGGTRDGGMAVARTSPAEWIGVLLFVPLATWGLREWLLHAGGASPFWDALTTALSLAAQALMCRKRLENWLVWIVADLIYIPLYVSRELPLTASLYVAFLLMCAAGWRTWGAEWRRMKGAAFDE